LKTFLQYVGVALAFVPVGIAYGLMVATRGERLDLLLVLLGIGFVTARFVWRRLEVILARWGVRVSEQSIATSVYIVTDVRVAAVARFQYAFLTVATVLTAAAGSKGSVRAEQGWSTVAHTRLLMLTGA